MAGKHGTPKKWFCVRKGKFKVCRFPMRPPGEGFYNVWMLSNVRCSVKKDWAAPVGSGGQLTGWEAKNLKVFQDDPKGKMTEGRNSGKFQTVGPGYDTKEEAELNCECPKNDCQIPWQSNNNVNTSVSRGRN
tara:strand:- start:1053 stop:1448 length:396 start_codon:yes stop_codon:yes gene_type:complete